MAFFGAKEDYVPYLPVVDEEVLGEEYDSWLDQLYARVNAEAADERAAEAERLVDGSELVQVDNPELDFNPPF